MFRSEPLNKPGLVYIVTCAYSTSQPLEFPIFLLWSEVTTFRSYDHLPLIITDTFFCFKGSIFLCMYMCIACLIKQMLFEQKHFTTVFRQIIAILPLNKSPPLNGNI